MVALYVDDIPIVGTPSEITQAKVELSRAFPITDLGLLSYYLSMQVTHNCSMDTLTIHQNKFINEILKSFPTLNTKPCNTPLPLTCNLSVLDG